MIFWYMTEDGKKSETPSDQNRTLSTKQKIFGYLVNILVLVLFLKIASEFLSPFTQRSSYQDPTLLVFYILILVFVVVAATIIRNAIVHNKWCIIYQPKKDMDQPEIATAQISSDDTTTLKKIIPPLSIGFLLIAIGVSLAESSTTIGMGILIIGIVAVIVGIIAAIKCAA